MRAALLPLLLLTAAAPTAQTPDLLGPPVQAPLTARSFSGEVRRAVAYDYLLALPEGYADAGDAAWPLVLFLHGAGERGDSLDLVKLHGPPKQAASGRAFPFILVAPQAPADSWWDARALGALLDEVQRTHRVDADRVYVTGLSMGGFGTWALAETFPDRFAAVAPVCGGGSPFLICPAMQAGTAVWAFHGALDNVVPLQRSVDMALAARFCGGDVQLTVYPEAGHDSWTQAYDEPGFYDWLLAQRRGAE